MNNIRSLSKIVVFLICLLISAFLYAESFQITEVEYQITGFTRKDVLADKIPVDTKTIFISEKDFNDYITKLKQNFLNQRTIQTADFTITKLKTENDKTDIKLFIKTVDSWNFIAIPYPAYDSNTGLNLKLKLRDYNFLGGMEEYDTTLVLKFPNDNTAKNLNFSFGFTVPFKIHKYQLTWGSTNELTYDYGDSAPNATTKQSLSFSLPFFSRKLNFTGSQKVELTGEKIDSIEGYSFTSDLSVAMPFTLGKVLGTNLSWSPSVSYSLDWKLINPTGSIQPKETGKSISFSNKLNMGSSNWKGNFKQGYSASLEHSYKYKIDNKSLYEYVTYNSSIYHIFNPNLAIKSRQQVFFNFRGDNSTKGSMLRGIRDNSYKSPCAAIVNVDLPIKIVQTDWKKVFKFVGLNWNWVSKFDFEWQISPFFDMAIGHNTNGGTKNFSLKDGYYGTGIEMLVFPNKMRSIQVRASFGVDPVIVADKVGNRIEPVKKVTNKLFNTSWRNGSWWELFIGVGLFY